MSRTCKDHGTLWPFFIFALSWYRPCIWLIVIGLRFGVELQKWKAEQAVMKGRKRMTAQPQLTRFTCDSLGLIWDRWNIPEGIYTPPSRPQAHVLCCSLTHPEAGTDPGMELRCGLPTYGGGGLYTHSSSRALEIILWAAKSGPLALCLPPALVALFHKKAFHAMQEDPHTVPTQQPSAHTTSNGKLVMTVPHHEHLWECPTWMLLAYLIPKTINMVTSFFIVRLLGECPWHRI